MPYGHIFAAVTTLAQQGPFIIYRYAPSGPIILLPHIYRVYHTTAPSPRHNQPLSSFLYIMAGIIAA